MKQNNKIILAVIFMVMALVFAVFALGAGLSIKGSASGVDAKKIECSGTIDVPIVGKSTLQDVQCRTDKCSALPFGIFSDSGNLKLYVDGELQTSRGWSSTLAQDQTFTIKSGCVDNPQTASIILYNDNNEILNKYEVDV